MREAYQFYSRGPVRRETLLLGVWIDTPFGRQFHIQEQEVLWVRQDEAEVSVRWDDRALKDLGTFNDFYGPLTSAEAACDEAEEAARKLAVGAGDRLAVVVQCRVYETPCRSGGAPSYGRGSYVKLEGFFTGSPTALLRVETFDYRAETDDPWRPSDVALDSRDLAFEQVWSSRFYAEENAARRERFLAPFSEQVGVRTE